jgi:hypothetical protein
MNWGLNAPHAEGLTESLKTQKKAENTILTIWMGRNFCDKIFI